MEALHDLNFMIPLCIGIFWSIVFLQSGLDKIFDYKGNLSWLQSHFQNSFLKPFVNVMLITLTIFEFLAGILSLFGLIIFLTGGGVFWLSQGVIVSAICLLMLIFGQRLNKDYEGAKTIVIYFAVALLSMLALN